MRLLNLFQLGPSTYCITLIFHQSVAKTPIKPEQTEIIMIIIESMSKLSYCIYPEQDCPAPTGALFSYTHAALVLDTLVLRRLNHIQGKCANHFSD